MAATTARHVVLAGLTNKRDCRNISGGPEQAAKFGEDTCAGGTFDSKCPKCPIAVAMLLRRAKFAYH